MARSSLELEILVQRIQQQLAPDAEVIHDVRMDGRRTGAKRQIDVLVRERIGQYVINIVIDCKDYKHPVDVKGVEEFAGLLDDVGAQKGVLVCPSGFTSSAKTRAAGLQIDLYSPVDTDPHKWQASPTIPAICDFRVASISFGVKFSAPFPFRMAQGFFRDSIVFDESGAELGTCYSALTQRWNDGEFADRLGDIGRIDIFGEVPVRIDNGYGQLCPIELYAHVVVRNKLFLGQLPVSQISGFRDEMTGKVITNAFSVGILDPEKIWTEWTSVASEAESTVKPVISLQGVVCWDAAAGVELKPGVVPLPDHS